MYVHSGGWQRNFILSLLDISFIEMCSSPPSGIDKGNNKITELRTILQRESQNS
jgi:hypothetical protein